MEMKKRYYKIDVQGYGAEYAMGFVDEKEKIDLLRELAKEDEVSWNNYSEDGDFEVEGYEIEDVFHAFGGEVNNVKLDVYEIEKPEDYVAGEWLDIHETKEISTFETMSNDDSIKFVTRNPGVWLGKDSDVQKRHELSDDALVYVGYSSEKGAWNSYVIETEGEFDIRNLVFGVCSMDECINGDEIIDEVYYITPEQFKTHLETKSNDNSLSDEVRGVYKEYLEYFNEAIEEGEYEPHDILSDYVGELVSALKDVTNVVNDDTNPYDGNEYDPYPEFRLEQLDDAEGSGKSTGAKLTDIKGYELQEST
jgi:hypothetical protein